MRKIYSAILLTALALCGLGGQNFYVDSSAMVGPCLGALADPYLNRQDALTLINLSAGDTIIITDTVWLVLNVCKRNRFGRYKVKK